MLTRACTMTILVSGMVGLTGCGASSLSSTSENWSYLPIETIPDDQYMAIGDPEAAESLAGADGDQVRFRGEFTATASAATTNKEYRYFYWPTQEVYFAPDREMYFWQASEGQWRFGDALPASVELSGDERATFVLYTDAPFTKHDKIEKAYPAGGMLSNVTDQSDF